MLPVSIMGTLNIVARVLPRVAGNEWLEELTEVTGKESFDRMFRTMVRGNSLYLINLINTIIT